MAAKELPSPKLLRNILRYEPETGRLFWRRRPTSMFSSAWSANAWNARYADREAATQRTLGGYRQCRIFSRTYYAHRVVWAMVYGEWPPNQMDHINGNKVDNRLVNLRGVSNAINSRNAKRSSRNTSGVTGVCWLKDCGKWRADIRVANRNIYLGRFADFADAVAARRAASVKYGFHDNHGRRR